MSAFILPEVWPAQRANRKRVSEADRAYAKRISGSKQKKRRARAKQRRIEQAQQRARNVQITQKNKAKARPKKAAKTASGAKRAADTKRFNKARLLRSLSQLGIVAP